MEPKTGRKGAAFILFVIILFFLLIIFAVYWNVYVYQAAGVT
jgi:CHASE3 domain sensor protein